MRRSALAAFNCRANSLHRHTRRTRRHGAGLAVADGAANRVGEIASIRRPASDSGTRADRDREPGSIVWCPWTCRDGTGQREFEKAEHVVAPNRPHRSRHASGGICRRARKVYGWRQTFCVRLRARPARSKRCSTCPRQSASGGGVRPSAPAAWRDDAYQGAVSGGEGDAAYWRGGAPVQFQGRRQERRNVRCSRGRAKWRLQGGDFVRKSATLESTDLGRGHVIRIVDRDDRPRRGRARVSLLLGIAPPVDRYDFDALKTCTLRSSSSTARPTS